MLHSMFDFVDTLGPLKIIHVHEFSVDLKAVLVIDNIAKGPSIGGVRMAEDVSTEECFRLARAMTLKNAAADLPHGGGKIVIYGDPRMSKVQKMQKLRALASALRTEEDYIFGPDMGMDEECMAWIRDEVGRVAGLPRELGGIPLDEIGATGWGVYHAADIAARFCNFELAGARVAIQGFGAVGKHAARFLVSKGAILVAASDSRGAIYHERGLNVDALIQLKQQGKCVTDYPEGIRMDRESIIDTECEIWIPAARPDVIHEDNVHRLRTKLIVQGANIPITHQAEAMLTQQGVLYVPDFIANAGGVICAAMEYHGATETAALVAIEEKIRRNTELVLTRAKAKGVEPRQVALEIAIERVKKAMSFRRFSSFSMGPQFI